MGLLQTSITKRNYLNILPTKRVLPLVFLSQQMVPSTKIASAQGPSLTSLSSSPPTLNQLKYLQNIHIIVSPSPSPLPLTLLSPITFRLGHFSSLNFHNHYCPNQFSTQEQERALQNVYMKMLTLKNFFPLLLASF